ncbi:hypothetical protein L1987_46216 [Smallanthus sonchifolius]|uniref:Uncharacterized protein n=1 Tax=Smallanthus sonchifolius TaxID=185202 RepID=A0ACB9FZ66_9ASTR|nr:hypothetical protein L1987_46216 [Smallanthus sonchifolius]
MCLKPTLQLFEEMTFPQAVTPGTNHRTKRQQREIKQTRRENLWQVRVLGRAGESSGVCESGNQQADIEVLQVVPPLVELRGLFVGSSPDFTTLPTLSLLVVGASSNNGETKRLC